MRIFQNIFLTKEEKEYLKLYQERYHKLSLKERKYVLGIYRKNTSDDELKIELSNFFDIKNEEEWKEFKKYYSLENVILI